MITITPTDVVLILAIVFMLAVCGIFFPALEWGRRHKK